MTATFIAVPVSSPSAWTLFGVGLSAEAAIADAYSHAGGNRPAVHDHGAAADEAGFEAIECTRRLYDSVELNGRVAFTYDEAGLADLPDADEDAAAAADEDETFARTYDEDADGLFEDLEFTDRIGDQDFLPNNFYYRTDERVTWYEYMGDERYEVAELRKVSSGQEYWLQTADVHVHDATTAEIFLLNHRCR